MEGGGCFMKRLFMDYYPHFTFSCLSIYKNHYGQKATATFWVFSHHFACPPRRRTAGAKPAEQEPGLATDINENAQSVGPTDDRELWAIMAHAAKLSLISPAAATQ